MIQAKTQLTTSAAAHEGAERILPSTRDMLAPFFGGWRGQAPEPALPRAPKHNPVPSAARVLELA